MPRVSHARPVLQATRATTRAHVVVSLHREAVAAGVVRVIAAPARACVRISVAHSTLARSRAKAEALLPRRAPAAGSVRHARRAVGVVFAASCGGAARERRQLLCATQATVLQPAQHAAPHLQRETTASASAAARAHDCETRAWDTAGSRAFAHRLRGARKPGAAAQRQRSAGQARPAELLLAATATQRRSAGQALRRQATGSGGRAAGWSSSPAGSREKRRQPLQAARQRGARAKAPRSNASGDLRVRCAAAAQQRGCVAPFSAAPA